MESDRLEAFSDGVIAIIITIMVLALQPPHLTRITSLYPLLPDFIAYVLSFIFVGIYWNNHHHLFQAVERVNGRVLWANLHLLFWLSLIPFATRWIGENSLAEGPVALYGIVLFMAAVAYFVLVRALLSLHGRGSLLATAIRGDFKGKISLGIYTAAIVMAFIRPLYAFILYVAVAVMWLLPDRRIERRLDGR